MVFTIRVNRVLPFEPDTSHEFINIWAVLYLAAGLRVLKRAISSWYP